MAVESPKDVFESMIPGRLEKKPELAGNINAKYKFAVAGDAGGTWIVDLTTEGGCVTAGDGEADCNIDIEAEDLMAIISGELNGQMAFMTGKLKVTGDMMLAMKLGEILGG
jgi:putative sterol carrier protein